MHYLGTHTHLHELSHTIISGHPRLKLAANLQTWQASPTNVEQQFLADSSGN
jgi:hypothetical protein